MIGKVDPVAYQATTSDPGRAAVLAAVHAQILLRMGRRGEGEAMMRKALEQMRVAGVAASEMDSFRSALSPETAAHALATKL